MACFWTAEAIYNRLNRPLRAQIQCIRQYVPENKLGDFAAFQACQRQATPSGVTSNEMYLRTNLSTL